MKAEGEEGSGLIPRGEREPGYKAHTAAQRLAEEAAAEEEEERGVREGWRVPPWRVKAANRNAVVCCAAGGLALAGAVLAKVDLAKMADAY